MPVRTSTEVTTVIALGGSKFTPATGGAVTFTIDGDTFPVHPAGEIYAEVGSVVSADGAYSYI